MEQPPSPGSRSRSGCNECRRRRRKCDEVKPTCSNCRRSKKTCSYLTQLSWGGRSFVKSRFGECLSRDVDLVRVSSVPGDFVYGSKHKAIHNIIKPNTKKPVIEYGSDKSSEPSIDPQDDSVDNYAGSPTSVSPEQLSTHETESPPKNHTASVLPPHNPDQLSWLPAPYRRLLGHFIHSTTRSISAHDFVQHDYCGTLVPMALGTSHLLAAVLSVAASHRKSLGLEQNEAQLAHLKATSVQQFRKSLSNHDAVVEDTSLATTLVLCFGEIVAGSEKFGSWRPHLQGAATILGQRLDRAENRPIKGETAVKAFLWRWYLSFETLALISGKPLLSSKFRNFLRLAREEEGDYIDDLMTFSTKLIRIFGEINSLTVERHSIQNLESITEGDSGAPSHVPDLKRARAYKLIEEIISMQSINPPKWRPGLESNLSSEARADYVALNEAYHHVALLQVYRRILDYPSTDPDVQYSVKRIMTLLSGLTIKNRPCPSVAMLQPIFTAGCEACEVEDRDIVISLLNAMENLYGMGNVRRARELLKELWMRRDKNDDMADCLRWDDVIVEKGWDILPY